MKSSNEVSIKECNEKAVKDCTEASYERFETAMKDCMVIYEPLHQVSIKYASGDQAKRP